jgi:hypothetical protein
VVSLAKAFVLPQEGAMTEYLIALSLFFVLVWAIGYIVRVFARRDAPNEQMVSPVDPISTYIDENYGSHFVDDPISINQGMRRL